MSQVAAVVSVTIAPFRAWVPDVAGRSAPGWRHSATRAFESVLRGCSPCLLGRVDLWSRRTGAACETTRIATGALAGGPDG
ncbi:hypothetical protein Cch01nite_03490 [Cellulomonas chitinilytica]|uniref:Uncharacterized protein n=1 Tax=Cellulomonas chitinilytica TaxID=398759 RepID=A0A919TXN5_9CELL|nr:hypothetical protein Cch01nite_03490 [Cellulomonas chitinilytica]